MRGFQTGCPTPPPHCPPEQELVERWHLSGSIISAHVGHRWARNCSLLRGTFKFKGGGGGRKEMMMMDWRRDLLRTVWHVQLCCQQFGAAGAGEKARVVLTPRGRMADTRPTAQPLLDRAGKHPPTPPHLVSDVTVPSAGHPPFTPRHPLGPNSPTPYPRPQIPPSIRPPDLTS